MKILGGLRIDLGEVYNMADVFVNGRHVDFLWKSPFIAEVPSSMLVSGSNEIEIKVVNTWQNRLIGDAQQGAQKHTFTPMPFYQANSPTLPSGLVGPVDITLELK